MVAFMDLAQSVGQSAVLLGVVMPLILQCVIKSVFSGAANTTSQTSFQPQSLKEADYPLEVHLLILFNMKVTKAQINEFKNALREAMEKLNAPANGWDITVQIEQECNLSEEFYTNLLTYSPG